MIKHYMLLISCPLIGNLASLFHSNATGEKGLTAISTLYSVR